MTKRRTSFRALRADRKLGSGWSRPPSFLGSPTIIRRLLAVSFPVRFHSFVTISSREYPFRGSGDAETADPFSTYTVDQRKLATQSVSSATESEGRFLGRRAPSNCQYNQPGSSQYGLDRLPRLFILLQSPHTKRLSELSQERESKLRLSCFQPSPKNGTIRHRKTKLLREIFRVDFMH